jgi:hypothetical protein
MHIVAGTDGHWQPWLAVEEGSGSLALPLPPGMPT